MYKVRVYKTDSTSSCIDLGLGTLEFNDLTLTILSDSDLSVLYLANIPDTLYKRDEDTILRSISNDCHFIEFEHPSDLSSVCDKLNQLQILPLLPISPNTKPSMPQISLENLEKIIKFLEEYEISSVLTDSEIELYIEQICKILEESENPLEFFIIFKLLINSCSEKVFKELLAENNFCALLKVLEIDPELGEQRDFKTWYKECKFNNVLEVKDEDFIMLVHLNFRISFFKDLLVTKSFEERVLLVLNSFSCFVNEEIVRKFVSSADIRAGLVIQMGKENEDAMRFLKAIVVIAKNVVAVNCKIVLYETFFEDEVFSYFPAFWRKENSRKIIVEVLYDIFCIMPWNFKKLFLNTYNDTSFFEEFCIKGMDLAIDEIYYIGETLKFLFENIKEVDFPQITSLFFNRVLKSYIEKLENDAQSETSKCQIIEVLTALLQTEPNDSKTSFVSNGLFTSIYSLLLKCNSNIKIPIYKLFRLVVKGNDSNLISYFVKMNFFEQVFEDLFLTLASENLIFSLTFGILLSICESFNKELLIYVNKEFKARFDETLVFRYFDRIDEKLKKINGLPLAVNRNLLEFDTCVAENLDFEDFSKPVKRIEYLGEVPRKTKLNK